ATTRNNTDDVGLIAPKGVLTPPKVLGTISTIELRFSSPCATLAEADGLSRTILVTTSKAPCHPMNDSSTSVDQIDTLADQRVGSGIVVLSAAMQLLHMNR